jgi:hypothetical protein
MKKEIRREERISVSDFLCTVHDCVLDPQLRFFTDEVCFHLSDVSMLKTVLIWDRLPKGPFTKGTFP